MSMIEPNFFIIGAPKCGTTTLHAWLSQHPDIYMPKLKELRFYSHDDLFRRIGFKNYLQRYFSGVEDETIIGEATPAYLQRAETVIPRMKATLAHPHKLRIVALFRNPADRAFSHYLHSCRLGFEERSFSECVFDIPGETLNMDCLYVRESLYSKAVEIWLKNFHSNMFFFARTEDLNSGEIRRDIATFLNIKPDEFAPEVGATNVQASMRSKAVARFMASDSALKWLVQHLVWPAARYRLRSAITSLNTRVSKQRQSPDPQTRTSLLRAFSQDILRLQELTGLDLGDWMTGSSTPLE